MKVGLGLDLTKAKNFQQENMEKNQQIIKKAQENAAQQEGARISIDIRNSNQVRELTSEETLQSLGNVRTRGGQPDKPQMALKVSDTQTKDEKISAGLIAPANVTDDDLDNVGTSRKEYENEFYKKICSEVIEDFLYLGSDIVA